MSKISGIKLGPGSKISLRQGSFFTWAEASNIMRTFVVSRLGLMTGGAVDSAHFLNLYHHFVPTFSIISFFKYSFKITSYSFKRGSFFSSWLFKEINLFLAN